MLSSGEIVGALKRSLHFVQRLNVVKRYFLSRTKDFLWAQEGHEKPERVIFFLNETRKYSSFCK